MEALHKQIRKATDWKSKHNYNKIIIDNMHEYFRQKMEERNSQSMLHHACAKDNEDLMKTLIADTPHKRDSNGFTPLHYVCVGKEVRETKISMFIGVADFNAQDLENHTPLHLACCNPSITDSVLGLLIKGGADPDAQDTNKSTPLHYVCANPHLTQAMLSVLLVAGANQITQDCHGCIPLHYACEYGHVRSAAFLISHSQDPVTLLQIENNDGNTPPMMDTITNNTILHYACEQGNEHLMKMIIESDTGATPHIRDSNGYTPLHYVCVDTEVKEAKISMFIGVADFNARDPKNRTPLHLACCNPSITDSVLRVLIDGGADPNAPDAEKCTPLHYASANPHLTDKTLKVILEAGANIALKDSKGLTPIDNVCKRLPAQVAMNCLEYLLNCLKVSYKDNQKILNDATKSLSFTDEDGKTALHHACEAGQVVLVENLVRLNVDVNAQDNTGCTPLMNMAYCLSGKNEQKQIVQSLLNHGNLKVKCRLDTKANVTKNTALHLACTTGNSIGVQLLLSNGAAINCRNSTGCTPLHVASQQSGIVDASCTRDIIFSLTNNGCDINAEDRHKKTALHYSVNCRDPSIPLSLIAAGCNITAKDNDGKTFSCLAPPSLMQEVKKELLILERRHIVCVIGHSKCGKSTLIAALEKNQLEDEAGWLSRFLRKFRNIILTSSRTAGIEVKVIHGKYVQNLVCFDFAGHEEYYSSHLAFLESALSVKGATVTLIMMTDGRYKEEGFHQCRQWLFPIQSILKEHNQLDVLFVCSHFDQLWFWKRTKEEKSLGSITNNLKQSLNCENMKFVDYWGMDCRKSSSRGLSKLEQYFQNQRRQRLSDNSTSKVSLAACLLLDKLQKNSLDLCISVGDIAVKLKDAAPPFPLKQGFIDGLCLELASSGLALYIRDEFNMGKSLLILKIEEVLTRVHGKLFAPNSSEFPMRNKNLANKFGLVNASELERAFKDSPLKPDVIGRFLIAMEFCHPVDADLLHSEIGQLLGTTEPGLQAANSRNWLCFPSLVSTDPPKQKLFDEEHIELCPWMCWELCTVNPHYFTPRFQHALFVRLGAKYVHHDSDDSQSEIIKHSCQVWRNGMFWSHPRGVHICIEIKQKCIVQILASGKPNLQPPKMNPVINLVSGVAQEVHIVKDHHSPGVATTSYLRKVVRGSPSDCCVLVNNFINAIKVNHEYVNNKEDGSLINIGDFLDDWNPCLSILEKMVLAKKSEVEAATLSPCSSSESKHTHSLDLPTPSDTTMVQRVSESLPIATVHPELPSSSHMRGSHKTADNLLNLLPSTHQSVNISRSQLVFNTDILEPTSYSLPKLSEVDLTEESLNFHIGKCIGDSWEKFATHLHIHRNVIEGVHKECSGIVRDCFVVITRKWLHSQIGTGDLPRTWQTVFDALEKIDCPDIAEDVEETLVGKKKVQMLLNKYSDQLYSDVDSHAIYRRLEVKRVIPNSLAFKIERTSVKESNNLLFLHLRDHGDMEALRRFCDVLIKVGEDGYPRMLQFGQSFKDSICQHIQVAPSESI